MKVRFRGNVEGLTPQQLAGLPVGWPKPPSGRTLLKSLSQMTAVVLAVDEASGQVAGYVAGMTDGVLIAYVWDVEVQPANADAGLAEQLLGEWLRRYGQVYQVNAHPDRRQRPLFERAGLVPYRAEQAVAMTRMITDWQDGGPNAA